MQGHAAEPPSSTDPPVVAAPSVVLVSRMVDLAVLGFVTLIGTAIVLYPGGTIWDPRRDGHAFWENYLCDLLDTQGLSGAPNLLGSRLAALGMLSLVFGLVALIPLLPALLTQHRLLNRGTAGVGMLAFSLIAAVPLLPRDHFGELHAIAVIGAGVPATLALAVVAAAMLLEAQLAVWLRGLSLLLVACIAGSLALFMGEIFLQIPAQKLVPVVARTSNLLLLAWMLAVSRAARLRSSRA